MQAKNGDNRGWDSGDCFPTWRVVHKPAEWREQRYWENKVVEPTYSYLTVTLWPSSGRRDDSANLDVRMSYDDYDRLLSGVTHGEDLYLQALTIQWAFYNLTGDYTAAREMARGWLKGKLAQRAKQAQAA
jgi:hypothetical protein